MAPSYSDNKDFTRIEVKCEVIMTSLEGFTMEKELPGISNACDDNSNKKGQKIKLFS